MEPTGAIFGSLSLTCYSGGCALPTHAIARLGKHSVSHPPPPWAPKSQFGQASHLSPIHPLQGQSCNQNGWQSQAPSSLCCCQVTTGLSKHCEPHPPCEAAKLQPYWADESPEPHLSNVKARPQLGWVRALSPTLPMQQPSHNQPWAPSTCHSAWVTTGRGKKLKVALSTQWPSHDGVGKHPDPCHPWAAAMALL